MNKKYAQITNLLNELEFYENSGLHKLADEIIEKIKKVAFTPGDFNAAVGMPGFDVFMHSLTDRYACNIPECYQFFCGGSAAFTMHRDFTDFAFKSFQQNRNSKITDVAQAYQGPSNAVNMISNLSPEDQNKLNACYQKLSDASRSDHLKKDDANKASAQIRETPPKRSV